MEVVNSSPIATRSIESVKRPATDLQSATFKCIQSICRKNAREVFLGTMWLPTPKRAGIFSCIAFYRLLREAICPSVGACDAATTKGAAAISSSCSSGGCGATSMDQTISMIRDRLSELYAGQLQFPDPAFCNEQQHVLIAIQWAIKRFQIPLECFVNILEGLRKESELRRFATRTSLNRMAEQVGGSMAMIAVCILGSTHSETPTRAQDIGSAGYLAHILHNLTTHLSNGKIQIPLEELAKFKVTQNELQQGIVTEPIGELMRHQFAVANQLLVNGQKTLPAITGDGSRLSAAWFAYGIQHQLNSLQKQMDQLLRNRHIIVPKIGWLNHVRRAAAIRK